MRLRGLVASVEWHSLPSPHFARSGLMMPAPTRQSLGPALLLVLFGAPVAAADDAKLPPPAARKADYAKDIQPIFAGACYSCHGEKKQQSSFRLDRKADALKGGEGGKAIVPGKSAESPLVRYVAGLDPDIQMPPKGERLTAEQVGLLRAWIDQGA